MGQTLTEPVTEKTSSCCRDDNYLVGSSCMQGWRMKMEDCHVHILSLPDDLGTAFFAVYDGHGGATMSQYAGKRLHEYIVKTAEYQEGNIVKALEKGFMQLDKVMQNDAVLKTERSGTTVIAVLIKDNVLYCANAGDSRAIACVRGETLSLSRDHKPTLDDEKRRIEDAGGWVEFNRVNGHLALSRALGDFKFKRNDAKSAEEQVVTAFPEVKTFTINEGWEFLILACDGIWDVLLSTDVVDFIRKKLASHMIMTSDNYDDNDVKFEPINPEEICEQLLDYCLAPDPLMGTGCDNMTVILVCFLHGKPQSDLILRCQRQYTHRPSMSDLMENFISQMKDVPPEFNNVSTSEDKEEETEEHEDENTATETEDNEKEKPNSNIAKELCR